MKPKSIAELIAEDPDVAEFASMAGVELGDEFEDRPLLRIPQEPEAMARVVDGWVERGVARKCAKAVLTDKVEDQPPIMALRAWQKTGRPWLRLQGGRGVGKTWAGGVWLMEGRQADGLQIEGAETAGWADWDKRWEMLAEIPRLVADDIDIAGANPKMWYAVLSPRYRRGLETILTTNALYDPKTKRNEFWEWWGPEYRPRMESRFAEIGQAKQLGGEDLRRRSR